MDLPNRDRLHALALAVAMPAVLALAGCASPKQVHFWDTERFSAQSESIRLHYTDEKGVKTESGVVRRAQVARLREIVQKLGAQAAVQVQHVYVNDQEGANAAAGHARSGNAMVTITVRMLELLRDDADAMAALVGHEIAHLAKRHGESRKETKDSAAKAGLVVGTLLQIAGVPFARAAAGLGADMTVAAYSRDQEREADELGVRLMHGAGFDPHGAVRLLKLLEAENRSASLPFLRSHPIAEERIVLVTELARALSRTAPAGGP